MGETSVYFVPHDEARWVGREREVADMFWNEGVFLSFDFVYARIREWKARSISPPAWRHAFQFGSMGLGGLGKWEPVPSLVYDLRCPKCDADIFEVMHEVWEDEGSVALPDRSALCPSCRSLVRAGEARSDTPYTFARFFVWVSDIDDDWDPAFKQTVEAVLGTCSEYQGWEA